MDEFDELELWTQKARKPFGLGAELDFGISQDPQMTPSAPGPMAQALKAEVQPQVTAAPGPVLNIVKPLQEREKNRVDQAKGTFAEADAKIEETFGKAKRPSWEEIKKMLEDDEKPLSTKEIVGASLIAVMPGIIGGLIGGRAGAAGAAQGGVTGTQFFFDQKAKEAQKRRDNKLKEAEYKIKTADQEAEDSYKQAKLILDRYNAEVQIMGKASDQTTAAVRELLKIQQSAQAKGKGKGGGGSGGGKMLSQSTAMELSGANFAVGALNQVTNLVNDNSDIFGPTAGAIAGLKGKLEVGDDGKRAAQINAVLKTRAQEIGKYLEGGKLAEGDINRYIDMLPKLGDSEDTIASKISNLNNLIAEKQRQQIAALKGAGYRTDGIQTAEGGQGPKLVGGTVAQAGVKRQYSPSRNQTRFIYPDGRVEVKDGKH